MSDYRRFYAARLTRYTDDGYVAEPTDDDLVHVADTHRSYLCRHPPWPGKAVNAPVTCPECRRVLEGLFANLAELVNGGAPEWKDVVACTQAAQGLPALFAALRDFADHQTACCPNRVRLAKAWLAMTDGPTKELNHEKA